MPDVEWTPDSPPDDTFQLVGYQARLAAHHHLTLKEQGLCEYEALELTREWMACTFTTEEQ
jgi:hypothetical protein